MKPGKIVLLHGIGESQPATTFKFKKMKHTPAKVFEKNVILILAVSVMLMAINDLWRIFR